MGEDFDEGMDMSTVNRTNDFDCCYVAEYCIEK